MEGDYQPYDGAEFYEAGTRVNIRIVGIFDIFLSLVCLTNRIMTVTSIIHLSAKHSEDNDLVRMSALAGVGLIIDMISLCLSILLVVSTTEWITKRTAKIIAVLWRSFNLFFAMMAFLIESFLTTEVKGSWWIILLTIFFLKIFFSVVVCQYIQDLEEVHYPDEVSIFPPYISSSNDSLLLPYMEELSARLDERNSNQDTGPGNSPAGTDQDSIFSGAFSDDDSRPDVQRRESTLSRALTV